MQWPAALVVAMLSLLWHVQADFPSSTSIGILSILNPTSTLTAVNIYEWFNFTGSAHDIWFEYLNNDPFSLSINSTLAAIYTSANRTSTLTLGAYPAQTSLVSLYQSGQDGLYNDPLGYLWQLSSLFSANTNLSAVSSPVLSQMTGILEDYKLVASQVFLNATPSTILHSPGATLPADATFVAASPVATASSATATSTSSAMASYGTKPSHITLILSALVCVAVSLVVC